MVRAKVLHWHWKAPDEKSPIVLLPCHDASRPQSDSPRQQEQKSDDLLTLVHKRNSVQCLNWLVARCHCTPFAQFAAFAERMIKPLLCMIIILTFLMWVPTISHQEFLSQFGSIPALVLPHRCIILSAWCRIPTLHKTRQYFAPRLQQRMAHYNL